MEEKAKIPSMVESGDDTIIGGNAKDEMTGGPGADTFNCGHGDDTVPILTLEKGILN